jgi:hypothetical protein
LSGTHNFQDWNPANANMESDSAYTADSMRQNGAVDPSIFYSALANKVLRQPTVFVAALMDALAAKGYSGTDSSRSTLATMLAAIMTAADMAVYATQAWVSGQVSAAISTAESTAEAAVEAWAQSGFAYSFAQYNGYIKFPSFLGGFILQWAYVNVSSSGTACNFPTSFPNACLAGVVCDNANSGSGGFGLYTNSQFKVWASHSDYWWVLAVGY